MRRVATCNSFWEIHLLLSVSPSIPSGITNRTPRCFGGLYKSKSTRILLMGTRPERIPNPKPHAQDHLSEPDLVQGLHWKDLNEDATSEHVSPPPLPAASNPEAPTSNATAYMPLIWNRILLCKGTRSDGTTMCCIII